MTPNDFKRLLGVDELPEAALNIIKESDFTRQAVDQDFYRLKVLKNIDKLTKDAIVTDRQATQIQGWDNIYRNMEKLAGDIPAFLVPPLGTPIRLEGQYVVPTSELFEYQFLSVVRAVLFSMAFANCKQVYEYGCGSGHNLIALGKQYPHLKLVGLDWSSEAVKRLNKPHEGLDIRGEWFDMLEPEMNVAFPEDTGVLTIGAMEQLGTKWQPFLEYLMRAKPSIVLQLEPAFELYDSDNLFDFLAIMYHTRCDFLSGYLPTLFDLANQQKIDMFGYKRIGFGSEMHEAYTLMVWRPL